jgi:cyclophilin family peptidyl-prolyl cis-trans isomerase
LRPRKIAAIVHCSVIGAGLSEAQVSDGFSGRVSGLMASRWFTAGLLGLSLGAAMIASPALAQGAPGKDPVKPIKIDPIQRAQTITYAVDTDITHDPDNVLLLDLSNGGRVAIRLMPEWAPSHVERIKTLTKEGFYNGVIFHRVIDGFMAQTGDPTGTGQGGSKLPDLKAEFNDIPHLRGTVSMARTDEPNTANSQFFIVFYPRFALDHKYTNFGRVIAGMDIADAITRGEPPKNPTRIVLASLASESKPAPPPPAAAAPTTFTADMLSNSQSN